MLPLDGVCVLDFTRVVAGPYCTMMLADLGADVIKIEEPTRGDDLRTMVNSFGRPEHQYYFYAVNRNKRSVAVDLKSQEGKKIIYDLASRADIALENFSPGVVTRLGIDYKCLGEINPRLVYCSISGFGQTGPYRDLKAFDGIIQALAGTMSATGFEGNPPVRFPLEIGDICASMQASYAIMAAYVHRLSTGKGQYIDVAMLDSLVALWVTTSIQFFAIGRVPVRLGNDAWAAVPSGIYRTADDRYITLQSIQGNWSSLCQSLGIGEIATDPRFDTVDKRVQRRAEVNAIIEEKTRDKPAEELVDILRAAGIPCGRVNNLDEVVSDPHLRAREMWQEMEHPVSGTINQIGIPYKLSLTPGTMRTPPPLLGQHTAEVLQEKLGYDAARVADLEARGVVRCT